MTGKQPKRNERPGVDAYGRTALHYAAAGGDESTILRLVSEGLDPNATDDNRWTALHFACQQNSAAAVRALLDARAAVDPRDSHGNTPLFKAVFSSEGNGDIISMLRAAGADPFMANNYGVSPISLSRSIATFNTRQFFADLPGVEPS